MYIHIAFWSCRQTADRPDRPGNRINRPLPISGLPDPVSREEVWRQHVGPMSALTTDQCPAHRSETCVCVCVSSSLLVQDHVTMFLPITKFHAAEPRRFDKPARKRHVAWTKKLFCQKATPVRRNCRWHAPQGASIAISNGRSPCCSRSGRKTNLPSMLCRGSWSPHHVHLGELTKTFFILAR